MVLRIYRVLFLHKPIKRCDTDSQYFLSFVLQTWDVTTGFSVMSETFHFDSRKKLLLSMYIKKKHSKYGKTFNLCDY